jgi:hypothetical protein
MSAFNPCRSLFSLIQREQKEERMDASRIWGLTLECELKDEHGRVTTKVPVVLDFGEYGQQASFVDVCSVPDKENQSC